MASDFIAHVEIPAVNIDKAADFFNKLFNWNFKPFGNGYLLHNTHKSFTIGIRKVDKVLKGETTIFHIRVDDINKYTEKAAQLGGEIFRGRTTIPAMGYYALIKDIDGNIIGLYQGN